jgi:hypothetical protein
MATLSVSVPRDAASKELEIYVERANAAELDVGLPIARSASKDIDVALGDLLDRQVGDQVIIAGITAGITAVKEIFVAACTTGALTCFIVAATACVFGYMAYRYATNDSPSYQGGTFTPTRRGIEAGAAATHRTLHLFDEYHLTDDCDLRCQLHKKVPHGRWTHFANATIDGTHHRLHHFRNGTTAGIRAAQMLPKPVSGRNPYN